MSGLSDPVCVLQCLGHPTQKPSCNNCEKQRDLDARLADARDLVLSLENERIALLSSIAEKNDPITSSFPLEITSHIFKLYVDLHAKQNDYFDSRRGFQEIQPGAALKLGAVCRKWRTIAWSTPWLWTTLLVDLLSKGHAHGPDLVGEWLERTRGLGVDVQIYTARNRQWMLEGHAEGNAKSTVKVLNRFLAQIRCLDMDNLPFNLACKLKDLGPASTSKLQHLCLGGGPGGHERDIESSYDFYTPLFGRTYADEHESPHCPTHIHLGCAIPFHQLDISWTKVTHIDLLRVSRATSFDIIEAAAQSLTHIRMAWVSDDDTMDLNMDDWVPATPIQLPWLLSLDIGEMYSHVGFTATIFNSINAPSLKSLSYGGPGHGEDRPMPVDAIIACIQRSSCSLEHLVLDWPAVQHMTEIIRVLRQVPALKSLELTLKSGQSVDHVFFHLAHRDGGVPTGGQETYLRHLEKLKLNIHHPFDWNLFVSIWLTWGSIPSGYSDAGSHIIDFLSQEGDLKVEGARQNLSVSMAVRGKLEPSEHFVGKGALMSLLSLSTDLHGSISVTADGKTSRSVSEADEYDLLERSFLHHFPGHSKFLPVLKSMNKTANM